MQENTVVQETTSANQGQISGQNVVRVVEKTETAETKRMKEHFNFFGPVTFLYAVFYAFCMFHNGSGITFPFFLAGTLLYFVFSLSKLKITLKKGSTFYMISILLLGISTFCTDGWAIISLNKLAVFLLVMCLLLNQYFDTKKWNLGKYVGSICQLIVMSFGELGKPFSDGKAYFREKGKVNKKVWYGLLGVVIALPIVLIAAGLLSSADAVFRKMTTDFMNWIRPGNIFNVVIRVTFLFFTSYALTSYLCKRSIPEEVKDRRKGEPVLAITIMSLLSLLYLLFSGIQIFGLFLGKMQLPEGYTYAQYAREGFFQLLAVSILNLILVLVCLSLFRESKVLKVIMTIMSLCTFIMIASSVMRMIIYMVLLSDFPADLCIVDAGSIIRHVCRSTDQHLPGKLPFVPLWCGDSDRAVSGIVLQPSRLYYSQSEYCQCTRRGRYRLGRICGAGLRRRFFRRTVFPGIRI